MKYPEGTRRLAELRNQIAAVRGEMRKVASTPILRVSDLGSAPGDDFCALWHFLDLLPEGAGAWRPRFGYA